jgi:hypothetical protein
MVSCGLMKAPKPQKEAINKKPLTIFNIIFKWVRYLQ